LAVDAEHRQVVATARSLAVICLELGLLAVAPCLFLVIRYFSWGAGPWRLLCYALLFGFVWLVTRRAWFSAPSETPRRRALLTLAAAGLVIAHMLGLARGVADGGECLTDMGRPSLCAGEWLARGLNPWADCVPKAQAHARRDGSTWSMCLAGGTCIDRKVGGTYRDWTHHGPGFDFMDGYKYGPLLVLVYAPFAHFLRERGLFIVNSLFWLAQLLLLIGLARAAYPEQRAAPARAVLGWLLPLALPVGLLPTFKLAALGGSFTISPPEFNTFILELTRRCANDMIPVVLALFATLLVARGRPIAAGGMLGLSLAAKQLPGLLLCLLLPRMAAVDWRRLLLAAVLVTGLCYWPPLLWAPRELFANLVLFGFLRPTNSSSIRAYLPAGLESLVAAAQIGLTLWVALSFGRGQKRDLPALLRSAALISIVFVALNKVVHGNYLLWLQPFVALALAGLPFRTAGPATLHPPAASPAR
jgi:hypothetical protein